jgi:hypothetical protein
MLTIASLINQALDTGVAYWPPESITESWPSAADAIAIMRPIADRKGLTVVLTHEGGVVLMPGPIMVV